MTTSRIKPCPFCRATDCFVDVNRPALSKSVYCSCGARGPKAESEIGAITLWNVRVRENAKKEGGARGNKK